MSESEKIAAALETRPLDAAAASAIDEEDRLRPEFVDRVLDAVDAGDDEIARELVAPLHPADVADLIGLSLVHTNRTIQELRSLGLIRWDGRVMTITDLAQLHKYAEFDPTYLNLMKRPR